MEAANFDNLEKSLAENQFLGGYFQPLFIHPYSIDKPQITLTEKLMNN